MRRLRRHRRESGQMLVVTALLAVLLVGATALAVDLSLNTQTRRSLQNITDSAALAGAHSLPASQTQALKDALDVVERNSPWSGNSAWLTTAQSAITCAGGSCTATVVGPSGYTGYTVTVSSPPAQPKNAAYNSSSYIEVDVASTGRNGFAGVIGAGSSTETGHSVAYNAGPPGPYQFTFFAKEHAGSGNQVETVTGDAYVGSGYITKGVGGSAKGGLCISELPGPEPSSDPDGDPGGAQDSDLDDQGHLVFGVVPPTVGNEPLYSQPAGSLCSASIGKAAIWVQQPSPQASAPTNCPAGSTPQQDTGSGVWMCVLAAPAVPSIAAPTPTQPALACSATVTKATAPGVYPVPANCTVTLDFSAGNIDCVSLVLGTGSSVSVNNKKGNNYITSYGFDPTGDTSADNAISAVTGGPVPTSACGGSAINADRSVIWAPDPGAASCTASPCNTTALSNASKGCCSDTLFIGTVYVPNQNIDFTTNQAMEDVGSVYCGDWNVQSGNHPNPTVTYDKAATAFVTPSLRLVE